MMELSLADLKSTAASIDISSVPGERRQLKGNPSVDKLFLYFRHAIQRNPLIRHHEEKALGFPPGGSS